MNQSSNNDPSGHPDTIDERIAGLREELPSPEIESRLVLRMRQRWQSIHEQPRLTRRWSGRPPITVGRLVAACAIAVALLFLTPFGFQMLFSSQPVYAAVLAAVRAAQTIHAKGVKVKQGEPVATVEIWYDAKRGVREDFGAERVRIDDGKFEWMYRASTNTVIKSPSRDPVGEIEEMLRPVEAIDRLGGKRSHELDATLDGVECRAFVAVPRDNATMRCVLWLDDQDRLIRFEEQLSAAGAWRLDERIDMQYDVPIPAERFAVNLPPKTRVIDRTAAFKGFDLQGALATVERLGIVLAIHDVRRVDDDTVYVMSTSRASPEVINRFGKVDSRTSGDKVYGEFAWSGNGRRLPDHRWRDGMQVVPLARWRRDGVDYQWVLLRHTSSWMQNNRRLPVGFHVYARDDWQKSLKAAGKPWHTDDLDVLSLNVPAENVGLNAVLAHVYAQASSFGDATAQGAPSLYLKSIPFSKKDIEEAVAGGMPRKEAERLLHGRSSQPEDILLSDWQSEVLAVLAAMDRQMNGDTQE
jgi:outer membrane lipoprotein-sorting protein